MNRSCFKVLFHKVVATTLQGREISQILVCNFRFKELIMSVNGVVNQVSLRNSSTRVNSSILYYVAISDELIERNINLLDHNFKSSKKIHNNFQTKQS